MSVPEETPGLDRESRRRLARIERLPATPGVVIQLIEVLADDEIEISRIEEILESDQALTSKVLSLANSAYYGFTQEVTTITRAVTLVGLEELQLLALGSSLTGIFDDSTVPEGWDYEQMWHHCLVVSWIAQELAWQTGYESPGEVMVAGLMHDLGKLMLAACLTEEYGRVIELTDGGLPFHEAEARCGLVHTEAGRVLGVKWGLPPIHLSAVSNHHRLDDQDPHLRATCLVHLADMLAKELGYGLTHHGAGTKLGLVRKVAPEAVARLRAVGRKSVEVVPEYLEMWSRII